MPGGSLDHLKEELAALERAGTALHPRVLQDVQQARTRFDGRDVINLASNNYLGLAGHPRMKKAASEAAARLGAGSGAVRTIAGTMSLHVELEERFAAFKGAEASIMFQSGFTANSGTVAAILTPEDVIVSDQLNHASIIDGARLSRAEIKVFPHKDVDAADRLLAETKRPGRHQLLITDGVFSMEGDIAPLDRLVQVAEKHGAIMMIDDAHASGVLGTGGKGTVSHFGLDPSRVDIQVGTPGDDRGGGSDNDVGRLEWLQPPSEHHHQGVPVDPDLGAESAADIRCDHPDGTGIQPERARQSPAVCIGRDAMRVPLVPPMAVTIPGQ